MLILSIESSCDETAAAVITDGPEIRSNVVATQIELHERFGGIVPEIASRAHVEQILPVIDQALTQADVALGDLDAIAVTQSPGLAGSLLIGLTAAKTLSAVLDIPLVTLNHLVCHIYACQLDANEPVYPCVALVVSGGHTHLYWCESPLESEPIGATIDDAAGEAFDKVATLLGLGYPGGPVVEKTARSGNPRAFDFPRSLKHDPSYDFSFSGIKTAVLYEVEPQPGTIRREFTPVTPQKVADIAASFQEAVVDVLVTKTIKAALRHGAERVCVGGGVACNGVLRERMMEQAGEVGVKVFFPRVAYCVDNAAMGALALEKLKLGQTADLEVDVVPGLVRLKSSGKKGKKS